MSKKKIHTIWVKGNQNILGVDNIPVDIRDVAVLRGHENISFAWKWCLKKVLLSSWKNAAKENSFCYMRTLSERQKKEAHTCNSTVDPGSS